LATAGETEVEHEEPLIAGVIHGVRKWEVGHDRKGNPRLLGYADFAWQPWGRPTIAACLSHAGISLYHQHDEPAPASACSCGLYAHHPWARSPVEDYDLLAGVSPEDDWLVGVVEAWGQIEIHEDGFRAQFARPILLIASSPTNSRGESSDLLDRVAAEYRCFSGRVGSAGELRDLFGEVNRGLDRSVVKELTSSIPPPPPWNPPPPPRVKTWSEPRDRPGIVYEQIVKAVATIVDGAVLLATWLVKGTIFLLMAYFAIAMYGGFLFVCGFIAFQIIKAIVT
jgi:hypothetical protein